MKTKEKCLSFWGCGLGLAMVGVWLSLTGSANAKEDNPFALEQQGWRSFERFEETSPSEAPTVAVPQDNAINEPVAELPAQQPAEVPQIRSTTLPAVQTQFDVRIDSTSDDHAEPAENEQDVKDSLAKEAWQDPQKFLEQRAGAKLSVEEGDEGRKVNIRLPMLPSGRVEPTGAVPLKTATDNYTTAKTVKAETVTAAQAPAACTGNTAVLAAKKKQLAAIDSDRQTLAALKEAIAQLKAEKELGFMTNVSGSLASSGPMDLPPDNSLINTLKN